MDRRLQRIAATFNARARKHHAPGVVTPVILAALHVRSGGHCTYCGIGLELRHGSWDHVIPLSAEGVNTIDNIVRCCLRCQREKGAKSAADHQTSRELVVTCARPGCDNQWKPRWAERQRGMARFCSHQCAGASRGKSW